MTEYPHDLQTEMQVLGGALEYPELQYRLVTDLNESAFHSSIHQGLYTVMKAAQDKKAHVGPAEAAVAYRGIVNEDHDLSGLEFVHRLKQVACSRLSAGPVFDRLREFDIRRQLMDTGIAVRRGGQEGEEPGEQLIEDGFDRLSKIQTQTARHETISAIDAVGLMEREYGAARERQARYGSYGIPSALGSRDRRLKGFQPPRLYVLAARPGNGKTADAIADTLRAAFAGFPVYWASYELKAWELANRLIRSGWNVDATELKRHSPENLSDYAAKRILEAKVKLSELPIMIDDDSRQTPARIRAGARRFFRGRMGLVIIDYMQKMPVPKSLQGSGVNSETGWKAQQCKTLAKDLNCPVLALAQMNRAVEQSKRRPVMSDLRGSGWIEQEADVVEFIHNPVAEDENNLVRERVFPKIRDGIPGVDEVFWVPKRMCFSDDPQEFPQ